MVAGGVKCVKWLIFVFNFLFFLTGCGLIGVGVWLNVERDDWEGISDYDYISVANVIIAAGAIIVIVAFLGCCGAITENKIMLLVFFVFLLIIFILEIGAGIAAYVWRGEIEDELKKELLERVPFRYHKEDGVLRAVNSIQDHFDCCGVDSFKDWSKPAEDSTGKSITEVPESCCINSGQSGSTPTCTKRAYSAALLLQAEYNQKGCYDSIKEFLEDNLLYVGITGIIFAVFQIIGMVFAMVLYCAIRKEGQIA